MMHTIHNYLMIGGERQGTWGLTLWFLIRSNIDSTSAVSHILNSMMKMILSSDTLGRNGMEIPPFSEKLKREKKLSCGNALGLLRHHQKLITNHLKVI